MTCERRREGQEKEVGFGIITEFVVFSTCRSSLCCLVYNLRIQGCVCISCVVLLKVMSANSKSGDSLIDGPSNVSTDPWGRNRFVHPKIEVPPVRRDVP